MKSLVRCQRSLTMIFTTRRTCSAYVARYYAMALFPSGVCQMVEWIKLVSSIKGFCQHILYYVIRKLGKLQKNLACSLPDLALPPLANSSETIPITDRRSVANVVKLTPAMIDACWTHSNIVNSWLPTKTLKIHMNDSFRLNNASKTFGSHASPGSVPSVTAYRECFPSLLMCSHHAL